jgi:hypothetical protein
LNANFPIRWSSQILLNVNVAQCSHGDGLPQEFFFFLLWRTCPHWGIFLICLKIDTSGGVKG